VAGSFAGIFGVMHSLVARRALGDDGGSGLRGRRRPAPIVAVLALVFCHSGCAGFGARAADPATPVPAGPAAAPAVAMEGGLALETFDTVWVRISRTYYDPNFRGVDWAGVRAELRPRAAEAGSNAALRAVLADMLGRLGESHFGLIPAEAADAVATSAGGDDGGAGDVGLDLRLVGDTVVVWRVDAGGPAAAAGVRAGWVVDAVGERRPAEVLEQLLRLYDGDDRLGRTQFLWSVNGALEGRPGSTVRVRLRDGGGRVLEQELVRRTRPGERVRFGNLPALHADLSHGRIELGERCVGVIRFTVWMVSIAPAFDRAVDELRDCAGIVLDLRGNPGGLAGMVMGVSGHFVAEQVALGTMRMREATLNLVANPRRVDTAGAAVEPFAGPLAVLIDGLSVSTSEIFAAGMQAIGRARVFGETSAGQALPAVAVRLPNRDVLMHVIADLTAPDGSRIEGRGVVPDVPVALRREDLLAGRDAVLDAAVRWVLAERGEPTGE
jgi:carboxyl-terminal processing protease